MQILPPAILPNVGTVCEDSPIGFDKWLTAVWMIANAKNGINSWELHRELGVTQKTAWFMLRRIRLAMQTGSFEKAAGQIEVDETFIGGKARNTHKHVRQEKITGIGGMDKTMVVGVLERGGKVRATVTSSRRKKSLQAHVRENIEPGAKVFTEALKSYEGFGRSVPTSSCGSRRRIRQRPRPYEWLGELLVPLETHAKGGPTSRSSHFIFTVTLTSSASIQRAETRARRPGPV